MKAAVFMDRTYKPFIPDQVRRQSVQISKQLPLDIEIGSGAGLFAIQHSLEHQNRQLIAIEHTKERFQKLQQRALAHTHTEHLHVVHANAISWIAAHCPEKTVDHIYLLYPNPWPKSRHQNQRWHRMPFMGFLLARLKPDGRLTLATNLEWYAEEAHDWFQHHWSCQASVTQILPQEGHTPRTHFERKYLERGQTCYDIVAKPITRDQ